MLALPFLLLFLAYLVSLLAGAEGPPYLLAVLTAFAWLMLFAIIAAGLIPVTATVWQGASGIPPGVTRLAADISSLSSCILLGAPVAAASVLAPSILTWAKPGTT